MLYFLILVDILLTLGLFWLLFSELKHVWVRLSNLEKKSNKKRPNNRTQYS